MKIRPRARAEASYRRQAASPPKLGTARRSMEPIIVQYWDPAFLALYGDVWPRNYACIDCETSGYSFDRDVITQWGHVLVQDGVVTDRLSLFINWTNHPVVPDHWLRTRLSQLHYGMSTNGRTCHTSYERLARDGMQPEKALRFIHAFLTKLQSNGVLFVAHGGSFDEKMLCACFSGFNIAAGFSFGDNGLLDTEGIEKASQCLSNERMHTRRGDTLRSYFHRVRYSKVQGVHSNLDQHCYQKYGFAKAGIRTTDMHCADVDAYCTHLLMERFAAVLASADGPPPPVIFPTTAQRDQRAGRSPAAPAALPPESSLGRRPRLRGQRNN